MDREEILELTWQHVDEAAGVVWAPRARTGAPRQMPLNDRLRAVLEQARRVRSVTDGGRVFLDARGRPLGLSSATGALARAYRDAQLEVAGPWKILRHTFGSRLAMARVAPQAIAALMGHTTMAVTQCYVHLSPGFLRGALDPGEKSPQKAPGDAADGTWGGVLDSFHVKRLALRAISA